MVASYTPNARLTKQGTNDNPNTWGSVLNNQVITLIEDMSVGVTQVDCTGASNVTLTTANGSTDQARHAVLELTGVVGADIDLLVPSVDWVYMVRGAHTGNDIAVKINGSPTEVIVSPGDKKIIYTNGTDTYDMADLGDYLRKDENLSGLTDTTVARANLGLGDLATQNGTTFLSTIYPVGSIYMNATSAVNPATLLGFGTWIALAPGRVLLGAGEGTDSRGTVKTFILAATAGEYEHQLLEAEGAPHKHFMFANEIHNIVNGNIINITATEQAAAVGQGFQGGNGYTVNYNMQGTGTAATVGLTSSSSGGATATAHNNIQPYLTVSMWQRTA